MSTSEIIEYEGRRFVRTGERRTRIESGEWYMGESVCLEPIQCSGGWDFEDGRELLRELPAETPVSNLAERLREACNGRPACKVPWPHRLLHEAADAVGLLAEAEEALARLIEDLPVKRDWLDPALESRAKAVLARIRAAKEKQP